MGEKKDKDVEKDIRNDLVVRISSDPVLQKRYLKLKEPQFVIPDGVEDAFKQYSSLRALGKSFLISKITSADDYQTHVNLISKVQNLLDNVHELNTQLYFIQHRWIEILNAASRIITINYFGELDALRDGVRKTVMQVALGPVQDGVDRLQYLIERGEATYKHLTGKVLNVKEGASITKEYLSMLKYGLTPREL